MFSSFCRFFRLVILFGHYIRCYASLIFICEQLTHTVWCCTKALCIIFVLLSLSFATAVQWILYRLRSCLTHSSCSTAMDLLSLLSKLNELCDWKNTHSWPVTNWPGYKVTVTMKSLHREKTHRLTPGGSSWRRHGPSTWSMLYLWHVCENMKAVLYSCHHIISNA